ncbi:hypothetical protein NX774_06350 [Massilia agilis]|uniref:Uncharacterized protein n=1 Tax=Massilia agilis TaxID=1811226 RepID=A0ABT2D9L8_9BURK|nr:hypothetical protein [Massilia agilis]MCS0807544.1 hypothetical protein [Massilia agilis]
MPQNVEQYNEIGFIKYSGTSFSSGVIDAGSAGSALTSLDQAIRYFNIQQSPDFASLRYDVPVLTRAGSWEAVLLASSAVAGAFTLGYAKKAGEKLAENDFKDIGLKHALSKSMSAMQTVVRLIKLTKHPKPWELARIEPTLGTDAVVVETAQGDNVEIPMEFHRWYRSMPPRLLVGMTSVVRKDQLLTIGAVQGERIDSVTITATEKSLFDPTEQNDLSDEVLFPELVHGMRISIQGRLIRGSEASNSLGLEHKGHVINCVPAAGSVRQFKPALFLQCAVEGRITRHNKNRFVAERRPTIIIDRVTPLEVDPQSDLFDL